MSTHPKHLRDDELLALLEEDGSDPHLTTCSHCQRRQAEFGQVLQLASQVPEPAWTPLQGEQLVHATRRRLHGRRHTTRATWKPALGGALAGALGCLFLLATWSGLPTAGPSTTEAPSPVAMQSVVDVEEGAIVIQQDVLDDEELAEDEVAVWLESYLVQTASDDELLLELDGLSDEEYYALLDE